MRGSWIGVAAAALVSGCSALAEGTSRKEEPAGATDAIALSVKSAVAKLTDADATEIFQCMGGDYAYVPVPAMPANGFTDVTVAGGLATSVLKPWPGTSTEVGKLLSDISLEVSKLNTSASSNVAGMASAEGKESVYLLDFMKYRLEPITSGSTFLGWAKVGVGLRILIKLSSGEGSVGGTFASLVANVKGGKAKGTMSISLVGVNSAAVTAALPFTFGDLTEASIDRVLEGMTVLKTKLYDQDTSISPRTLAKVLCKDPTVVKKPNERNPGKPGVAASGPTSAPVVTDKK